MASERPPGRALTRAVPSTFADALVRAAPSQPIDVERARAQHQAYVRVLRKLGLEVLELPADPLFPDCCFVEDCVVVHGDVGVVTNPGAASRRGETVDVMQALAGVLSLETMVHPARLDGGDCLRLGRRLYVGLSTRTNRAGLERLRQVFVPRGLEVVAVEVTGSLHLKSLASPLGEGRVLVAEGALPPDLFRDVEVIPVPPDEALAANCLAVGCHVLVPSGYPVTLAAVERAGFTALPLETSEINKADGALTCLSVLY